MLKLFEATGGLEGVPFIDSMQSFLSLWGHLLNFEMKNDGKIGKEYVRKEVSEKQFPNLKIIQASLFAASCYSNVCSCQRKAATGRPIPAGNQGIYDGVPVIDLLVDTMPSFLDTVQ